MFQSTSRVDKKAQHATPPTYAALLSAAAAARRHLWFGGGGVPKITAVAAAWPESSYNCDSDTYLLSALLITIP